MIQDAPVTTPLISNKAYDVLKPLTTIILPGLVTLWLAVSGIWGFPNAEEIAGTIGAINLFLGLLIGVSSKSYNHSDVKYAGAIVVEPTGSGGKMYNLELNGSPHDLDERNEVTFKVRH